ncbi:cell division protein [Klebsiella pneumoniae subsp. rhinoscleromatis]|nr:cell division protein [Klebsiella pneumoniae subsp. rhinoscleromatis]
MTIRGLQVPGPLIGGAARMMSPNADWAPVLPIRQSAATLWYQANTPNRMAKQVLQRSGGHVAGGRRGQQEPADP